MPASKQLRPKIENRLLAALTPKEHADLSQYMELVHLPLGKVIIAQDEPIRDLVFPTGAMISLVSITEEGKSIEAGVIGCEGVAGIPALLGAVSTPMQSVVQIAGQAIKIRAGVIKGKIENPSKIQQVLYGYMHALFVAFSQSAACNRLHPVEGRLARWLLIASDAVQSDKLPLTHEYISTMLGIRRVGVTQAAVYLRSRGLIDYRRGEIHLINKKGLEEVACECYRIVKKEFDRMLGSVN